MAKLRECPRHEASYRPLPVAPGRPSHRLPGPVRPVDYCTLWNVNPFAIYPDPVMTVFGFPVDVIKTGCIRAVTTVCFRAGREAFEPAVQFRSVMIVGEG